MNPRVFPTSCGFFIIVVLIISHIPTSLGADDAQYSTCSQNFQCANIADISYPFWGGTRPEYCGHPSFGLNCTGDFPQIAIMSTPYRVLDINHTAQTLTVVREEFWGNTCPRTLNNASMDTTHFNYANGSQDMMLYYGCSESMPNITTCNTSSSNNSLSFYETSGLTRTFNKTSVKCDTSVILQINQTAATTLRSSNDLTRVIESGFGLVWEANNSMCDQCVHWSGRCGSSSDSFVCYCSDQPYALACSRSSILDGRNSRNVAFGFLTLVFLVTLACFPIIVIFCLRCCVAAFKNKETVDDQNIEEFLKHDGSLAPKRYRYSDLNKFTNSFRDKLGQGGYGAVYKGKLYDNRLVAVKILRETTGNGEEFINEVASISRTSHINVVALLGFCFEKNKRALVYEFMAKGSLDKFIYNECHLELRTLYQIAVGTARGLEYLHRGCSTRIIHFDIKPQNILVDEDFCPKISDFGLAKLCQRKDSIISMTGARGTTGYIAPEVFSRAFGGVSHKSDVYSYGMLVLEMTGARAKVGAAQTSEIYFPQWIYEHLEYGRDLRLHGVNSIEDEETARKMILVGLWCIQTNPLDRPPMSRVVDMLEGSLQSLQIPPKPYLVSVARPDPSSQYSSESLSTVSYVAGRSEGHLQSM